MDVKRNDDGAIAVIRDERMQVFAPGADCIKCGSTATAVIVDGEAESDTDMFMGTAMCDKHIDEALDVQYDAHVTVAEFRSEEFEA